MLLASEGLSLVYDYCNVTSILSSGKIQNTVVHFIFIVFFQSSHTSGKQGHTKSSEEGGKEEFYRHHVDPFLAGFIFS